MKIQETVNTFIPDLFTQIKLAITVVIGFIVGLISDALGGWTPAMKVLFYFMAIDYLTGLIVAGFYKKSPKTSKGGLESRAALKGLIRKGVMWLLVFMANLVDGLGGTEIIRTGTVMSLIITEFISISENLHYMKIDIPKPLKKALNVYREQEDKQKREEEEGL